MKNLRIAAIGLLAFLLGAIIFQNTGMVRTRFLFFAVEMPQIVLLALTALGGYLLGLMAPTLRKRG